MVEPLMRTRDLLVMVAYNEHGCDTKVSFANVIIVYEPDEQLLNMGSGNDEVSLKHFFESVSVAPIFLWNYIGTSEI